MSTVFLLAGEYSGDALGGRLMAALKVQNSDIVFDGVGGPLMQAEGLQSYVPMEDLCVMGIVEVLKHYPRLRRLGFEIIEHIERTQPDVVVTIDLPDFNFAVAKRLKKRRIYKGKIVHYVAPSVWAWRPGRARKVAQFLDGLICLFPFEPPYFEAHGLRAEFAGHSMIESEIDQADGAAFRVRHGIAPDKKVIGLLFGSRVREVEIIGPVFKKVMQRFPNVHFVVPTLPKLEAQVSAYLSGSYTLVTDDKWNAFAACDAAAAMSGTVALELAYMGVPHVIGYKMHPFNWFLVKLLVKTKYAHLANILLQREAVPELLQEDCNAGRQDLEIFYQLAKKIPQPIFDTQIAAMVCGYGEQVGYENLIKQTTGHQVDKSSQFTNWAYRPLSEKQIDYAIGDVTHLVDAYLHLKKELEKRKRTKWLYEEEEILNDPETYKVVPEEAWQRVKMRKAKPQTLAVLRELAAWRERRAQEKDLPKSWVMKDDTMMDLANQAPKDEKGLKKIRGLAASYTSGKHAKALLACIEKALSSSPKTWPKLEKVKGLSPTESAVADVLKLLLKIQAAEHDVATRLIASKDDIDALACEDKPKIPVMKGWRYEVFGQEALALKQGKLMLGLKGSDIVKRRID